MKSFARRNIITLLLFILVVATGILLVPKIGPAWDEPDNIYSAGRYILFFQKGFDPAILFSPDSTVSYYKDTIYSQNLSMYRYPPVPNYVGAVLTLIEEKAGIPLSAANIFIAFHLATVLFLALLVATIYRFSKLLGLKTATSVFAALVTFLYPALFGHGLSNLKDTAQATLCALSLYLLVKGSWEHIRHDVVLGAVVWGLAMATKINAVFVPIIWGSWVVVTWVIGRTDNGKRGVFFSALRSAFRSSRIVKDQTACSPSSLLSQSHDDASKRNVSPRRDTSQNASQRLSFIMSNFVLVLIIGLITTFIVWPVLWFNPVNSVTEVLRYFTTVGQGYSIYWDGVAYKAGSGQMLWWYPWANLFLGTPILLLFFIVIGILRVIIPQKHHIKERALVFVVLFWLLIPLIRAIDPYIAFYDGIRHFIEVLPAWIILGAIGLEVLWSSRRRWAFAPIGVAIIGHLLFINWTYFPYSTGYYNVIAQNPNKNFDRDIEALSVKEGMDYLHAHYKGVRLWMYAGGHLSWYWITPADTYVSLNDADLILLINKGSQITKENFESQTQGRFVEVHAITRGNVAFGWVYKRK